MPVKAFILLFCVKYPISPLSTCKQFKYVVGIKCTIENIGAILEEAGTDYRSVIKTTCFLSDMNDFAAFNEVYAKYFVNKPARSCVAVKTLPKNVLCEVEVIAAVE